MATWNGELELFQFPNPNPNSQFLIPNYKFYELPVSCS
jgi:hypothetical protein